MLTLGNISLSMQQLEQAETYLRAALLIEEEHFGLTHLRIAVMAWTLADLCEQLEKKDDAKELFLRCAEIWEENYGAEDAKTEEAK
jgi:tetratricopeptide (TPR) repeat protein